MSDTNYHSSRSSVTKPRKKVIPVSSSCGAERVMFLLLSGLDPDPAGSQNSGSGAPLVGKAVFASPQKKSGKYFPGRYRVKFGHFVNFLLLARFVPKVAKRSI